MALRVLVADKIFEGGVRRLEEEPSVEVEVRTGLSEDQLAEAIADFDGLIVRSRTQVTGRVLERATRLKVVGRAGVGVDNIDVEAASRHGVVVVNTPEGNTISAAEHTMAMMLASARRIPQAHHSLADEGAWERSRFVGMQLQGKVLGVIGLGRIGTEVAKRALGFEMQVIAYDPFITVERARRLGVELAEIDEICERADFITVHVPLTPSTRHLIGAPQFASMKEGVRLINCARGGIIDEGALVKALRAGKVAGAALDVFEDEPPTREELLKSADVVVTPHLGASTREAQQNVATDVAEEVARVLVGEPVRSAVNVPSIPPELLESLGPYLDVAERLGRLYTDWVGGGYPKVEVVYTGEIARGETTPLTSAVFKGMLSPILGRTVTLLNASLLAKGRGIRVVEVKQTEANGQGATIALQVRGEGESRMMAGSISDNGEPQLIMLDGYRLSVTASGHLLLSRHTDRPGMVGRVGTVLGEAGINIAFMQVGRKAAGGGAVMVLGVDAPVPKEVLERLAGIPDLQDIGLVQW